MTKSYPCRIDGIVARDAEVAVVFRRGPARACQMLVWDLASDVVTPGQWIRGRVYTKRCDLSPDGRHLVIAATNYSPAHQARGFSPGWTAVCRPPYFTAVAFWETGDAWNGGGLWKTNEILGVNRRLDEAEYRVVDVPKLKASWMGLSRSEDEPIFSLRLAASGWRSPDFEAGRFASSKPQALTEYQTWIQSLFCLLPRPAKNGLYTIEKHFSRGFLRREYGKRREVWTAHDLGGAERHRWMAEGWQPQWLDVDRKGRILYGEGGCLWAWSGFPEGKKKLIADLNENQFEAIPPPDWARAW